MKKIVLSLGLIGLMFLVVGVQSFGDGGRTSDAVEELAIAAILLGITVFLYRRLPPLPVEKPDTRD